VVPLAVRPIVLIDVFSVFFRAHHALSPMSTGFGEPTAAMYGFCSLLLKLLREHLPRGIAFALDAPEPTFRHTAYAEYKAGRERTPSELTVQLRRLQALLSALKVPVFRAPGFEADDVLATLADKLRGRSGEVLVVSGDRDLLQLARDGVDILFLGARGREPTRYDAGAVEQRFQVTAAELPAWMALVGDNSDNLPGVKGVGARTAAKLVRAFGSIEEMLAHLSEIAPATLQQRLREAAEQLRLNEELARLRIDVPLGNGPFAGALEHEAFAALRQVFAELEFASLKRRLQAVEALLLPPGDT
jgi:DNA polymerase-1